MSFDDGIPFSLEQVAYGIGAALAKGGFIYVAVSCLISVARRSKIRDTAVPISDIRKPSRKRLQCLLTEATNALVGILAFGLRFVPGTGTAVSILSTPEKGLCANSRRLQPLLLASCVLNKRRPKKSSAGYRQKNRAPIRPGSSCLHFPTACCRLWPTAARLRADDRCRP